MSPRPGCAQAEGGGACMVESQQEDITRLLVAWSDGDTGAFDRLADLVYQRLSRLASAFLRGERAGHTFDTGALVHEAFLRLIQHDRVRWRDRAHFFAISATVMRRILVDHARRNDASKRGGGVPLALFEDLRTRSPTAHPDLLALDDALRDLELHDPALARLVVMRYFGGLTKDEIAAVMDVSVSTVARRWRTARAWLYTYLAVDTSARAS